LSENPAAVDRVPELLADALEENRMPLVLSFYDPISSWVAVLPKMSPGERKNMVRFYRSLKLEESLPDRRIYKGPYVDRSGILRQNELKLGLVSEGRWIAE
jgi:hypothetical protein